MYTALVSHSWCPPVKQSLDYIPSPRTRLLRHKALPRPRRLGHGHHRWVGRRPSEGRRRCVRHGPHQLARLVLPNELLRRHVVHRTARPDREDAQHQRQRGVLSEQDDRERRRHHQRRAVGVHLDDGVRVLHDPRHQEPCQRQREENDPRLPGEVLPEALRPVGARPLADVVHRKTDGVDRQPVPVHHHVLDVQWVVVRAQGHLCVQPRECAADRGTEPHQVTRLELRGVLRVARRELARGDPRHDEREGDPLQLGEAAVEDQPEEGRRGHDLEAAHELIRQRVDVLQRDE
mmetsp:Transcript_28381/g.90448  ORF Transcript_28381/g.90448 Transcript_28381/m.90448 type:complete len:291 (-) Transcript_28381:476-1348(-)